MTKTLAIFAAVFALAAGPALAATSSAPPAGPFKLDATGRCQNAKGFVAKSYCTSSKTTTASSAKTPVKCVKGKLCGAACIAKTATCKIPPKH